MDNRPTHELLAENLGRIAKERGVSLGELADQAGVDRRPGRSKVLPKAQKGDS